MQDYFLDAHLDLAWNALQWNRDITQSVYTIRTQEATQPGRAGNTVALPEMHQGKVYLAIATLMGRNTGVPVLNVDFRSTAQTTAVAQGHMAYYRALEQLGHVNIIETVAQLDDQISAINTGSPDRIGLLIGMESADAILRPDDVHIWYELGVRVIGPAHYGMGRYAGGTGVEDGFTDAGRVLLREMQAHSIVLDLTHLSDRAFWEALESYEGPVIASHSNCRTLVAHQRQLDDKQIKAIAERNGTIGIAFDVWMLCPEWIKGYSSNNDITLNDVVDHIDYVCQLTGNAAHVAIGTDLDGGFGRSQSPVDLDTIADIQKIIPLLRHRGYDDTHLENILHQNWLCVVRKALP